MKIYFKNLIKIISIVLFSVTVVFSQSSEIDYEKLSQRYNIISEKDGLLKLEDKLTGRTIVKTENIKNIPTDYNFDLIIDLRTIDTTQYSKLFTFWSEVPVYYLWHLPLIIADANKDGRKDVYGSFKSYSSDYSSVIYEINSDCSYDSVYKYPDSISGVWCIGDLENDGYLETVNSGIALNPSYLNILSIDSMTGYPTKLKTIYNPTTGSGIPGDVSFYDMDGDEYPEMIYFLAGEGDSLVLSSSFQITKYDRINNQFSLVYQNRPSIYTSYAIGFAFGDFDLDGKQNFAASNPYGEVFVYEYVKWNNYNVMRIDSLPISNVYLQHFTNDLDHNGKPELWICGDGYVNGIGSQIIYIYEADGDDQYSIVYSIAVIGGATWFASNMVSADIDNDGTDEVLLCIDQNLLIFKYENADYELYYIKRNELLNQNSTYLSATAADFDGDNYPEIIISLDLIENNSRRGYSKIYKKTSTLDISNEIREPNDYYISAAFPNPFNPSTSIKFNIAKEGIVMIKVYDVLGKEVKTLLNESLRGGKYELTWNGTDNNNNRVSSGIYFINMVSGSFNKSIKTVLIK